jgi:hypothetical protein
MPLNLPKLHFYISKYAAVIPGDLDYAIPLQNHPRQKTLIPYPYNRYTSS